MKGDLNPRRPHHPGRCGRRGALAALQDPRKAQRREGWHLHTEPIVEPHPAADDQKWLIEFRAEVQAKRDGRNTVDRDEAIAGVDAEINASGTRGKVVGGPRRAAFLQAHRPVRAEPQTGGGLRRARRTQKRFAPHPHMAIRRTLPRVEIKQIALTYHQVWWHSVDVVRFEGDHLPVWREQAEPCPNGQAGGGAIMSSSVPNLLDILA